MFAGFEGFIALVDRVPVDDIPPGGQIFGTAVVVLEVIGVLPDVVAENREQALGDGVVLVGSGDDLNVAVGFARQPDPAAAELLSAGVVEFGLKILEAAEGF